MILGTYIITYNVSDAAANAALEVTRTVNVINMTEGEGEPPEDFEFLEITHRRVANEVLLPIAVPEESVPCGESFEFKLAYSGYSTSPLRWELYKKEEPFDEIKDSGGSNAYLTFDCSDSGIYYMWYYLDKNDNGYWDNGDPYKSSEFFAVKNYRTRYVNYTVADGISPLLHPFNVIMQQASDDLATKNWITGDTAIDYRVAVTFVGDNNHGVVADDEHWGTYREIRWIEQLDSLVSQTEGYEFRVIGAFFIREGIFGWEEDLQEPNDSLLGLTTKGEPRTAVVTYENAKLKQQWIVWIHEYVHGFQSFYGWSHASDPSYFMHPNCEYNYACVDSRDILESDRR